MLKPNVETVQFSRYRSSGGGFVTPTGSATSPSLNSATPEMSDCTTHAVTPMSVQIATLRRRFFERSRRCRLPMKAMIGTSAPHEHQSMPFTFNERSQLIGRPFVPRRMASWTVKISVKQITLTSSGTTSVRMREARWSGSRKVVTNAMFRRDGANANVNGANYSKAGTKASATESSREA